MGTVIVQDGFMVEGASHQFDRIKHHGHHWIEEGTDEDFKWCILNSDLPYLMVAMMGSGQWGAPMWRALQGVPDRPEPLPLMGTYVIHPADRIAVGGHHHHQTIVVGMEGIEGRVLEMLLQRPEVVNHESKAKAPLATPR